jgi:hypothetical protein
VERLEAVQVCVRAGNAWHLLDECIPTLFDGCFQVFRGTDCLVVPWAGMNAAVGRHSPISPNGRAFLNGSFRFPEGIGHVDAVRLTMRFAGVRQPLVREWPLDDQDWNEHRAHPQLLRIGTE